LKGLHFACIAAAWVWLVPLPAALAAPAWVHLEWQRPLGSSCPSQASLEQDVEQALGRPVFTSAQTARLQVRATIEDRSSGVVVRLQAQRMDGQLLGMRELRAQPGECAALRADIGLVLTLLVERDGLVTEPSTPSALRLDPGLWTGFLLNTLPRGTFGVGPALSLELGAYAQLRADAAYWLPVAVQTAHGIRAELQAASLALRVCPRIAGSGESLFSLRLCGGVQLGALFASQTQPQGPATQVRLLVQGLLELRSGLRLGRTARLELALGPLISLNRTSLVSVRSDGSRVLLYRAPTVGMILSLGLII
jgi:hypothetical protein